MKDSLRTSSALIINLMHSFFALINDLKYLKKLKVFAHNELHSSLFNV